MAVENGEAKFDEVDVAVLLRDRRVKTEWRLPVGEIMSSYGTVSEGREGPASDTEVAVDGRVTRESTDDWLEEVKGFCLWKANMAAAKQWVDIG